MKKCDACGEPTGMIGIGGTILCRTCAEDVRTEIDTLRGQGKKVNAIGIARRMYRDKMATSDKIIRDIPGALIDAIKERAHADKTTEREVVLSALRDYLKDAGEN